MSRAEQELRTAFERLKAGTPTVVPKGTPITQNNVAREAGKDPSAFKKSRYASLIAEIQAHGAAFQSGPAKSARQTTLKKRKKNRQLKEQNADLKKERDLALSLLVGADSMIIELHQRIDALEAERPPTTVRSFAPNIR